MIINIKKTPNPNSVQFIIDSIEWINIVWECSNSLAAEKSELSQKLWNLDGVIYLLFGKNFVVINKSSSNSWDNLIPVILDILSEYLSSNTLLFPVDNDNKMQDHVEDLKFREYSELEKKMIQVLDEKIQPAIAMHGGSVSFISFEKGALKISLIGACKDCPSSEYTVKHGIQELMKFYFPEIEEVINLKY